MVGSTSTTSTVSSISSLTSLSSSDDPLKPSSSSSNLKFLCSYGGLILPRFPDGRLRYVGGDTRVLSVHRSVTFSDLIDKMSDLSGLGPRVALRCQIPTEDLDALVSITSEVDLINLIEEYDLADRDRASPRKIRAFLFPLPASGSPPPSLSLRKSPPDRPRIPSHRRVRRVCGGPSHSPALAQPHLVHSVGYWR